MTASTPSLGLSSDEVREILDLASPLRSGYWHFVVRPDQIELQPAGPQSRESRLCCGAALLILRLALQEHGVRPLVTLLPGASAQDALAVVRHGGHQEPGDETLELLRVLRVLRANRQSAAMFSDAAVPAPHRQLLARAAGIERAWLHVAEWALADPLVVVLCSFDDGPAAELRAGQAMQRVMLTAATIGLSASPLLQPVCLSTLRVDLRRSLGGTLVPQTLLRMGFDSAIRDVENRSTACRSLPMQPAG